MCTATTTPLCLWIPMAEVQKKFLRLEKLITGQNAIDLINFLQDKYTSSSDDTGYVPQIKSMEVGDGSGSGGGGRFIYTLSPQGFVIEKKPYNGFFNKFVLAGGKVLHLNDVDEVDKHLLTAEFNKLDRVFYPISFEELVKAISGIGKANWGNLVSKSHEEADFTTNYLVPKYFEGQQAALGTGNPLRTTYISDQHYFRFGNDFRLFNLYDAGNLMWGSWMGYSGFSNSTAQLGAELNEFFQDTVADQRAITIGIFLMTQIRK